MLYLIFLVVIHLTFAQNYSCSSEASTQTSGEGPSGLAPTSSWFSTALGGQDQEVDCHLQKTSFTGSQTPCSATCRDGQTRSVEVQILYAPGQGQIRTMWRLLEVLVTMQRLELCAPAATAPSTSTWRSLHHRLARLARLSMARFRTVGFRKIQVTTETNSKPKTTCAEAATPKFQRRCEQGKRQGSQQGLCRTTLYILYMYIILYIV